MNKAVSRYPTSRKIGTPNYVVLTIRPLQRSVIVLLTEQSTGGCKEHKEVTSVRRILLVLSVAVVMSLVLTGPAWADSTVRRVVH